MLDETEQRVEEGSDLALDGIAVALLIVVTMMKKLVRTSLTISINRRDFERTRRSGSSQISIKVGSTRRSIGFPLLALEVAAILPS